VGMRSHEPQKRAEKKILPHNKRRPRNGSERSRKKKRGLSLASKGGELKRGKGEKKKSHFPEPRR